MRGSDSHAALTVSMQCSTVAGSACNAVSPYDVPVTRTINNWVTNRGAHFRFSYLASGRGWVFPNVIEIFLLDVNSTARDHALHVYQALEHPDSTVPTSTTSKRIHGKVGSFTLTRAYYDSAVRSANNRAALKACATHFPTYSTTNLECDEFPFQSTYEGARLGPDRFSVRPISKEANSSGGGQLSGFYRFHRILDTYDQFWVLPGTSS